jgi:hypothetical protein
MQAWKLLVSLLYLSSSSCCKWDEEIILLVSRDRMITNNPFDTYVFVDQQVKVCSGLSIHYYP